MTTTSNQERSPCRCCAGTGNRTTESGRRVMCTGCDGRGYFRLGDTFTETAKLGYNDYQAFSAHALAIRHSGRHAVRRSTGRPRIADALGI